MWIEKIKMKNKNKPEMKKRPGKRERETVCGRRVRSGEGGKGKCSLDAHSPRPV